MKARAVAVSLAVVVIAGALVAVRLGPDDRAPRGARAASRLILVSRSMPSLSQPGEPLHVMLLDGGRAAFRPQSGVVLSDDQCEADSAGVSHCLNTIRLASGPTMTVRHPHRMMDVACLTPGERVAVRMNGS